MTLPLKLEGKLNLERFNPSLSHVIVGVLRKVHLAFGMQNLCHLEIFILWNVLNLTFVTFQTSSISLSSVN